MIDWDGSRGARLVRAVFKILAAVLLALLIYLIRAWIWQASMGGV